MRGARTPVSVVRRRGQGLHSRSPWLVLVCVLPFVTLPAQCALVCSYVSVGKDCACLSVVLVLVFTALRFGVRLSLYGQGMRLSLRGSGARVHCRVRRCTNTACGQRLRLSLRGPGELRALVYGYGPWARIALSLRGPGAQRELRALVRGYGLWARVARVSPWSWCSAPLRVLVYGCSCFSVSWCSCVCEHSRDPTVLLVVIPVMAQMQIPMVRYLETLQLQYMTRWSTLCPCCAGLQVPSAVVDVTVETSLLFSLRTSFPGDVVVETVELSQLPLLRKSSSPGGPGQGC